MENMASLWFYLHKTDHLVRSLLGQDLDSCKKLETAKLLRNRIQSMEQCVDDLIDRLEQGENHGE